MTGSDRMIALDDTVVATDRQVDTQLEEDRVILNLENSIYYGFQEDQVAEAIWQAIQTPTRVSAVVDRILGEFEVERDACEADVIAFLNRLRDERLIRRVD